MTRVRLKRNRRKRKAQPTGLLGAFLFGPGDLFDAFLLVSNSFSTELQAV
jgi:hypothetical protein